MRNVVGVLLLVGACSSGGGSNTPANLNPVAQFIANEVERLSTGVTRLEQLVPVLLFPPARALAGITFELDTAMGAAPNTYDFNIPLDGDGNGTKETTISWLLEESSRLVPLYPES